MASPPLKMTLTCQLRHGVAFFLELWKQTQCQDVLDVIKEMYGHETPAMILVGHSMGGAVTVRVAAKRALPTLAGLVVVDVVEVHLSTHDNYLVSSWPFLVVNSQIVTEKTEETNFLFL
jgi:pimeloyl-ACP methyl ester carboxylesterase